jgi:hypothetical protein
MKSDEDVRMISAEAPVLFAKVGGCNPPLIAPTSSPESSLLTASHCSLARLLCVLLFA